MGGPGGNLYSGWTSLFWVHLDIFGYLRDVWVHLDIFAMVGYNWALLEICGYMWVYIYMWMYMLEETIGNISSYRWMYIWEGTVGYGYIYIYNGFKCV